MASPVCSALRSTLSVAIAALWLAVPAWAQPPATSHRQPVLVELFTSEGCSDCPPADALLARLDSTQFIPGAQAIVLSEHVTYWNHLGWRDPFSYDLMDQRQSRYASLFSLNQVYTPQMVVDGAQQFVGSNANALNQAVSAAASKPKLPIAIQTASLTGNILRFSVRAPANPRTALVVVLAQDVTRSEVPRGENAGRTLHHVAVARVLKQYEPGYADGRQLQLSVPSLSDMGITTGPLRLVAFLADRQSGHVVAATEQTINP